MATASLIMSAACSISQGGTSSPIERPASDAPDRFVLARTNLMPGDTIPGIGCRSPLYDPRDDTQIIMMRSAQSRGDYAVPTGRYGVSADELLRVECNTGRPLGIVRR